MKVLRNLLAVVAGIVIGSIVNMLIVSNGPTLIPPPEGVDVTSAESIAANIHLFEPRHFLMPFLAHALGTLVGALVAVFAAVSHKPIMGYVTGAFFLAGGIMAATMIPAPTWFIVADICLAYMPMALVAAKIGCRLQGVPIG